MPNNARVLASHVQACMIDGPCKDILPLPTVVWRDGGFAVVREATEGEQVYEIGLVRHNAPVEEAGVEVVEEVIVSEEPDVLVVEETPAAPDEE
jgi:hypothetical protein